MNRPKPKVSILMCVYNGEAYLQEAVDSILQQTFPDFEFVIVDDGSTDSSWQILTKYSKQDSRIVLISNAENLGLEKSLNKGLATVKGKYIARQDADDVSLPNRLQLQVDFLDAHPEVGALGSSIEFIDRESLVLRQLEVATDHDSIEALLLVNNCLWHSSMMMRRHLLQELAGYNENMLHAEDYDLWWRISRHSRLANLPDILLQYRQDNVSAISKLKRQQQLECAQKISLRAVQESLPKTALNIDKLAYERFWWAYLGLIDPQSYQKCWYSDRGKSELLRWQDIRQLQPFWDLLANHPAGAKIWGSRLYELVLYCLRIRQTSTGLYLLWVGWRQLQMPISWSIVFRSSTKPYLPNFFHRLWRIKQQKQQKPLFSN
ncbi:glycosyltransferase family 2 protein [Hyella patelloides]|nr:glycosyltransferase [Hyella patelloides]